MDTYASGTRAQSDSNSKRLAWLRRGMELAQSILQPHYATYAIVEPRQLLLAADQQATHITAGLLQSSDIMLRARHLRSILKASPEGMNTSISCA